MATSFFAVPPATADVDLPTWSLGDFWEYRVNGTGTSWETTGRIRFEVVGAGTARVEGVDYPAWRLQTTEDLTMDVGGNIHTLNLTRNTWHRLSDLVLVRQDLSGTDVMPPFGTCPARTNVTWDPPREIRWPLAAGAGWTATGWGNSSVDVCPGGLTQSFIRFDAVYTVGVGETVTVPAGTFGATPVRGSDPNGTSETAYWNATIANYVRLVGLDNLKRLVTLDLVASRPSLPPDYVPSDPTPASPLTVGLSRPVPLKVDVASLGGRADASATLAFFNASSPGTPFAAYAIPPIPPGGTAGPFDAMWTSPSVAGTYQVAADVDYANVLAEGNEANNVYTWTVAVVPGPVTTLVVGQPNVTAAQTYVTSATPLSLSVLDQGGSGIRDTRYQLDGTGWIGYAAPFVLLGESEHLVEWFSEDFAGNVEPVANAALYVDDTPPTTAVSVGDPKHVAAETFVTSATELSLAAVDPGAMTVGLAATEYRVDGGPWTPYSSPVTLSGEGTHVVEYRSADLLGNVETVRAVTFVVDDTPPEITVDVGMPHHEGADTYVTSATPFTITTADGGAAPVGLASVEFRVGGAWTAYVGSFTIALSEGPRTVEYRAADFLGNAFAGETAIVLDDTAPTTTPDPGDGTYPAGTTFEFSAEDAGSGVARTELRIDEGEWTAYEAPLALPEGAHTIRFRSVDNVGNTEAERVLAATISGEPPPPVATNWKPLVAAVFAAIIAVSGIASARRAPWHTGSRPRLRAFLVTGLPLVSLEAGTGVVSHLTGLLAIPPFLGVGTGVDVAILSIGIVFSTRRTRSTRRK